MSDPRVYAHNAIAVLASVTALTEPVTGVAAGVNANRTRMVVRHQDITADAQTLLDTEPPNRRVTLEDSFSVLRGDVAPGVTVLRMPVMVREPAPQTPHLPPGVAITTATDTDTLAIAEQTIVDGFPVNPAPTSPLLQPAVLHLPAWKVWLATRHGQPAAAGYTYDDGTAVGVYLLATLPQHRSAGLGRALMTTVLAHYPKRQIALVATEAGAPLYRSLGFAEVSKATWYIRAVID